MFYFPPRVTHSSSVRDGKEPLGLGLTKLDGARLCMFVFKKAIFKNRLSGDNAVTSKF